VWGCRFGSLRFMAIFNLVKFFSVVRQVAHDSQPSIKGVLSCANGVGVTGGDGGGGGVVNVSV